MTNRLLRILPWLALAVAAFWLVWFPIVADDADLFYHLNAGRYLALTGSIQTDSFFSFLKPPRPFIDYYWLFQAVVYRAFALGGYEALLVFRALVFAATLGLVLRFLWSKTKEGGSELYLIGLYGFVLAHALGRMSNVRPHVFSYLLLVVTLVLLESSRRRAVLALPVVAALWANLHGIEYPVLLLLLGAYFAEAALQSLQERSLPPLRRERLLVLALSPLALLASPYGWKLLPIPFNISSLPSTYINELAPGGLGEVLSFSFKRGLLSSSTSLTVLSVTAVVLAIRSVYLRKARVSHLLLLAGGAFLLSRGIRFSTELPLLMLPLLRDQAPGWRMRPAVALGVTSLLVALPLASFFQEAGVRPLYPLSRQNNHTGITAFLRKIEAGGTVLNRPDRGGYLAWELYPHYRTTTDMQSPFLFNEEDTFVALNLFQEPLLFAHWANTYEPDFLVVPHDSEGFIQIVADYPQYAPIFFDDAGVLFVDQEKYPALGEQYSLGPLNPFYFTRNTGAPIPPEAAAQLGPIAERVKAFDPQGRLVNSILFSVHTAQGDHEGALRSADANVTGSPNLPDGYQMRARAAAALGRWAAAAEDFSRAIELLPKEAGLPLQVLRGRCLAELSDWPKAYEALSQGVLPYQRYTPPPDLELLAMAASKAGHESEAKLYRRFAEIRASAPVPEQP